MGPLAPGVGSSPRLPVWLSRSAITATFVLRTLQICVVQLNFVVGDMPGNARKIIDAAQQAYSQGARLVLTPELSICGYAAEDLYLRPAFMAACDDAVKQVAQALAGLKGLCVVVGHPAGDHERARSVSVTHRFNAASVLCEGQVLATYAKRELPNYQVFDERRYFTPGDRPCVFEVQGVRVGLLICEDAWFDAPARTSLEAGAELLAVINASPFHVGKSVERMARMGDMASARGQTRPPNLPRETPLPTLSPTLSLALPLRTLSIRPHKH